MRALVQRVTRASVAVDGEVVGEIGPGLLALVGITHDDTETKARKLAEKLWHIRLFDDTDGLINLSLADTTGEILVVSQFTLYGDTSSGRRPGWSAAARPEVARPLIEALVTDLSELGAKVATGSFQSEMLVELVNDGPVTVSVEI